MKRRAEAGFSAVELLITLFIAAIFLTAGYQLYSYVLKSGADSTQRDQASSLAYQYLRRYGADSTTITDPCTASTPKNNAAITDSGVTLTNPKLTVAVTCPYASATGDGVPLKSISLVTATVTYTRSSGTETVSHAILTSPQ